MYSPILSVPAPCASAWVAETDPKYARAWLASLPLANSAEAAREIYQALYTVNRLELRIQSRLELLALHEQAVATVCAGLQTHLLNSVPPLGPKKHQLAEFIRRLHIEMAYGYKCSLRDLSRSRLSLRRKSRSAACIERALYHFDEVLLRSYLVYLPYPPGMWRETHELYRLAESIDIAEEPLEIGANGGTETVTIAGRYARILLLGLANPYQLPHGAAQQVHAFLARWGDQAQLTARVGAGDLNGCFLIDLAADAPPVPMAKGGPSTDEATRVLDARMLLRTVQQFVARLETGEPIETLGLGVDCLDSTCVDLLKRMTRAWGESARRRYARRQQSSNVFICIGLNAVHFYVNGQRPFAEYLQAFPVATPPIGSSDADVAFIDLGAGETGQGVDKPIDPPHATLESHRVDRWQLRDIGPQGMSLARYGDAAAPIRVGDLIGVQQAADLGRWRAAVIRWVKTPEVNSVEVGIELLAATVAPAAVRRYDPRTRAASTFAALRLPATEVIRRPSTLLLPRGVSEVGDEVELLDDESEPRRVRLLRLLERTGSFEQMVYGDTIARVAPRR